MPAPWSNISTSFPIRPPPCASGASEGDRKQAKGKHVQLGYCTNVHAGADLEQTRANLQRHAVAVKPLVRPGEPLGIGLWLSAAAAASLRQGSALDAFRDWLGDAGLLPYTVNGFPYYDFHQKVVKHN